MQHIWIDVLWAVKAIIILTLDFTLLLKSRIPSYSTEHVSAQHPSVRNCPERRARRRNIMRCQQLKWITVQFHSGQNSGEFRLCVRVRVRAMQMVLNCPFCFPISGEVLSRLISSTEDGRRDDVLGKLTVAVSFKRVHRILRSTRHRFFLASVAFLRITHVHTLRSAFTNI